MTGGTSEHLANCQRDNWETCLCVCMSLRARQGDLDTGGTKGVMTTCQKDSVHIGARVSKGEAHGKTENPRPASYWMDCIFKASYCGGAQTVCAWGEEVICEWVCTRKWSGAVALGAHTCRHEQLGRFSYWV